ncbi:hypothetical protein GOC91_19000 [Sinorhizobium medicae]|uniref:Uncharacterized protein n=2 Tax=Sinorhizobium medicae TaxID=110321 RepID=A0A508WS85_9HYPH|nr:hypothetical protein [Sinorhizobium medicae]ABR60106.1 hypothetical protein Smed_1256 [Sinorhizobium medicae WSM419]MBO1940106.1 hypothetical protein [Sinorhizobium medicae]MBO1962235.1 hypothetical protein [Sinorhizobium medicae]MDX0406441.1 hypothetical protein [Sinorhizobium medicae]MDX0412075.1 hypothetical protein [Sinorhizobium medicae]
MQLYFFDLHWDDECFADDEGILHFDEGSALYYGQRIADRIGRDVDYGSLKVRVRSEAGVMLAALTPSQGRGVEQDALLGRNRSLAATAYFGEPCPRIGPAAGS